MEKVAGELTKERLEEQLKHLHDLIMNGPINGLEALVKAEEALINLYAKLFTTDHLP